MARKRRRKIYPTLKEIKARITQGEDAALAKYNALVAGGKESPTSEPDAMFAIGFTYGLYDGMDWMCDRLEAEVDVPAVEDPVEPRFGVWTPVT